MAGLPSSVADRLARLVPDQREAAIAPVGISPHTCRHTFAITFLRNGGNLLALQRILGHQDLAMVRRYAELVASDLAAAQATASPLC
jgi:integrase/recombinase XerD